MIDQFWGKIANFFIIVLLLMQTWTIPFAILFLWLTFIFSELDIKKVRDYYKGNQAHKL